MTWVDWHRQSEYYAMEADLASNSHDEQKARASFRRAAELEERALAEIDSRQARTFGIIAISVSSLWFKAKDLPRAKQIASAILKEGKVPDFARVSLQTLLDRISNSYLEVGSSQSYWPGGDSFTTWDEYYSSSISNRLDMIAAAEKLTASTRDRLVSSGVVWALFCGDWKEPLIAVEDVNDIPDESGLIAKAKRQGFAPFAFSYTGPLDDLESACANEALVDGYPTIRMEYGGSAIRFHFDTGNPYSLFGYEALIEKGWISPILVFQMHIAGELNLVGSHIRLKDVLFIDSRGNAVTAATSGFAVMDWTKYRTCIRCPESCRNGISYPGFNNRICQFRSGLLGRNVAHDINRQLTIDFSSGNVTFVEGWQP